MKSKAELVAEMTGVLRNVDVDLGDERDVMRCLISHGFRAGDVAMLSDDAVDEARKTGKNLASVLGDGAAMVFAAGVWLAWYVLLCPAVSS